MIIPVFIIVLITYGMYKPNPNPFSLGSYSVFVTLPVSNYSYSYDIDPYTCDIFWTITIIILNAICYFIIECTGSSLGQKIFKLKIVSQGKVIGGHIAYLRFIILLLFSACMMAFRFLIGINYIYIFIIFTIINCLPLFSVNGYGTLQDKIANTMVVDSKSIN
ncbi:hypothetical protein FACS189411_08440 [Bacteroidia bacterium]|nr:hypothetical protein FACS189411_08440 [Bacteroidia bacterium]